MDNYSSENNKAGLSFLNDTILRGWQIGDSNWINLELYLGASCNLACTYCYLTNYGNELYPPELEDTDLTLKHVSMLCDWLVEHDYSPIIEIFSGEPLITAKGLRTIETVINKFSSALRKTNIVIPTNMTFLLNSRLTDEVERLIEKGNEVGVPVTLSASVDGMFCGDNRPMRNGTDYNNEEFYKKVFDFAVSHQIGFHPMIYSAGIDRWIDNFLWFQKQFVQYNLPWQNLYLLEVRNKEWTTKQIRNFYDFVKFLVRWSYEKCGDTRTYLDFITNGKGFNILSTPLMTIGRGLGCSIQTSLVVRTGDLQIFPCHRLSYPAFRYGRFLTDNDRITGIEIDNFELMTTIYTLEGKLLPGCESCLIHDLCSLGCLGSQYETTGDLFTPIPTVCNLEHAKIIAMIRVYEELGIWDNILGLVTNEKKQALEELHGLLRD